ncbi:hypothetical protein EC991_010086 [Linnemannia zychae]|nr:hypothetical protein EC991_010086 [Linnemannia zychae]
MSILPVTLWGLDPLLHVPIQLMIFQVKALVPVPDYEGFYSHHTHPVRMIEIMGVIQSVNRATKYITYTERCEDPNAETLFRLRVLNKERDVYTKPLELPDFILQEVRNKENKDPVTMTTLLDRIRSWVLRRKEFSFLDIQQDPVNKEIAEKVSGTKGPALGHMMNCVKALLAEGLLECTESTMEYRVKESRQEVEHAPYDCGELIILDDD